MAFVYEYLRLNVYKTLPERQPDMLETVYGHKSEQEHPMTTWNDYVIAHHNYTYLDEADARAFRLLALLNSAPIAPGVVAAMLRSSTWAAQKYLERLVDKKLLRIDDRGLYYLPLRVRDLAQQQLDSVEPLYSQREARQRAIQWYSNLMPGDTPFIQRANGDTQDIPMLPPSHAS